MIETFAEIILDNLPDALYAVNNNGEVVIWNKKIEQLTGVKKKDVLGKGNYEYSYIFYGERKPGLIDLLLDKTNKELESLYDNFKREGNTVIGERKFKGQEKYLQGLAVILYNFEGNSIIGEFVTIKDITPAKELENNFLKIFTASPDPIAITNYNVAEFINVNPAWEEFTGYTLKSNIENFFYNNSNLIKEIINKLQLENKIQQMEICLIKNDNTNVYGILSCSTIYINNEKCIISIIKDITKQKKLEENLKMVRLKNESKINTYAIKQNKKFDDIMFKHNKDIRESLNISQHIIKTLSTLNGDVNAR